MLKFVKWSTVYAAHQNIEILIYTSLFFGTQECKYKIYSLQKCRHKKIERERCTWKSMHLKKPMEELFLVQNHVKLRKNVGPCLVFTPNTLQLRCKLRRIQTFADSSRRSPLSILPFPNLIPDSSWGTFCIKSKYTKTIYIVLLN